MCENRMDKIRLWIKHIFLMQDRKVDDLRVDALQMKPWGCPTV